jgi:fatty acid desaturase
MSSEELDPDKALVAQLAKADRVQVTVRTAVVLAVYAGVLALALRPGVGWWAVLLSVFLAFVLSGFLNAMHDCVHKGHLRSKLGNRIAGAAWATPLMLNFTIYRHKHLVHHRLTGVAGDTEAPQHFETAREYAHALSGVQFWPLLVRALARNCRGRFPQLIDSAERRRDARIDSWVVVCWLALMAALTVFFPFAVLIGYWLPLFFVMPAAAILSIPEHYGLWGTPDVMRNTRTVVSNGFVRYFLWNGNYHAEHHRFPAVASVNLHRLHKAMPRPHPVQSKSYIDFHWGLARALMKGDRNYGKVPEQSAPPLERLG